MAPPFVKKLNKCLKSCFVLFPTKTNLYPLSSFMLAKEKSPHLHKTLQHLSRNDLFLPSLHFTVAEVLYNLIFKHYHLPLFGSYYKCNLIITKVN